MAAVNLRGSASITRFEALSRFTDSNDVAGTVSLNINTSGFSERHSRLS